MRRVHVMNLGLEKTHNCVPPVQNLISHCTPPTRTLIRHNVQKYANFAFKQAQYANTFCIYWLEKEIKGKNSTYNTMGPSELN